MPGGSLFEVAHRGGMPALSRPPRLNLVQVLVEGSAVATFLYRARSSRVSSSGFVPADAGSGRPRLYELTARSSRAAGSGPWPRARMFRVSSMTKNDGAWPCVDPSTLL